MTTPKSPKQLFELFLNLLMKAKLIILLCTLFASVHSKAHNNILPIKSSNKDTAVRAFPWRNFTLELGVGILPYGTNSINKEMQSSYFYNPISSPYIGFSYNSNNFPIGAYIDFSLSQFYTGNTWVPFDWQPASLYDPAFPSRVYRLSYIEAESQAMNIGILYGKEIMNGFELYTKVGVGTSWHDYELGYYYNVGGAVFNGHFKKETFNYQWAVCFRYFPIDIFGFGGSFAFADNFPVYTLTTAYKFGYKYKKGAQ